jgi:hypothetical protein
MGSPARFSTADVTVAVNTVPGERLADGVKSAVRPVQVTAPATGPPLLRVKLAAVTVEHLISSLNVAVTTAFVETFVSPFDGLVALTVGPPGVAVVVKDHTWSVPMGDPAKFCTAPVTVAV